MAMPRSITVVRACLSRAFKNTVPRIPSSGTCNHQGMPYWPRIPTRRCGLNLPWSLRGGNPLKRSSIMRMLFLTHSRRRSTQLSSHQIPCHVFCVAGHGRLRSECGGGWPTTTGSPPHPPWTPPPYQSDHRGKKTKFTIGKILLLLVHKLLGPRAPPSLLYSNTSLAYQVVYV